MNTPTIPTPIYECPRHPGEQLSNVLRGGAGYCAKCRLYAQGANHPMPQLDDAIAAKRAEQSKPKPKKRAQAKPKKRAKTKREARQIEPGAAKTSGNYKYFP